MKVRRGKKFTMRTGEQISASEMLDFLKDVRGDAVVNFRTSPGDRPFESGTTTISAEWEEEQ